MLAVVRLSGSRASCLALPDYIEHSSHCRINTLIKPTRCYYVNPIPNLLPFVRMHCDFPPRCSASLREPPTISSLWVVEGGVETIVGRRCCFVCSYLRPHASCGWVRVSALIKFDSQAALLLLWPFGFISCFVACYI